MTEKEFKEKMKQLGYTDDEISEIIESLKEEKKVLGNSLPFEAFLIELPEDLNIKNE